MQAEAAIVTEEEAGAGAGEETAKRDEKQAERDKRRIEELKVCLFYVKPKKT